MTSTASSHSSNRPPEGHCWPTSRLPQQTQTATFSSSHLTPLSEVLSRVAFDADAVNLPRDSGLLGDDLVSDHKESQRVVCKHATHGLSRIGFAGKPCGPARLSPTDAASLAKCSRPTSETARDCDSRPNADRPLSPKSRPLSASPSTPPASATPSMAAVVRPRGDSRRLVGRCPACSR